MSRHPRLLYFAVIILLLAATGCQKKTSTKAASIGSASNSTTVAQQIIHVTRLSRKQSGDAPQFLDVTLLPDRGLNVFQITAYLPGKGKIHLLASPSLETAARVLTGIGPDKYGAGSYSFGGAFLIPYPNRIFGTLSSDKNSIRTSWHGHPIVLPANVSYGSGPTAGKDAMHGLILLSKVQNIKITPTPDGQTLTATLDAGNFGGHWLSSTSLHFTIALTGPAINVSITATNTGHAAEPMAIGWHPYLAIPSGQRAQVRLSVPATMRALVNNYQIEKPTGKLQPVQGTPYDFNHPNGKSLGSLHLDDSFTHLIRSHGVVNVKITDPAANYGMEVRAISPEIHAVQIYSPANSHFVAVEPQYNLVDPFGKEWHGVNTGMVTLQPGQSTTWHVQLHLFTPPR
jgi:galactose mutarotase-like enzyme